MRIAIITPCFNVAPYVGTAIRSVLAQTHRDWTMVVVDDGSSDDTAGSVRAAGDDPRICVIRQDNQGVSAAREAGLRRADPSAEAVLFLDADDWLASDALGRLAMGLAAAPGAVAVAGGYVRVTPDGGVGQPVRPPAGALLRPLLVRNRFINGGHVLLRRAAVAAAGPFRIDLAFGEDWEFWVRVALVGPFAALPNPNPVLYALDRASGAYRRLARDPLAMMRCLDAIHANPALADRLDQRSRARLRRRAEAEACWVLGRALLRHGAVRPALAWLRRGAVTAPNPRGLARLLAGHAAPLLPAPWRGPFRPYPAETIHTPIGPVVR